MQKKLDPANMVKDLGYIINGNIVSDCLFQLCPPRPGLRVLEAGCGSGKLGLAYAYRGAIVYLIDVDDQAIRYAERLRWALTALTLISPPARAYQRSIAGLVDFSLEQHQALYDLVFNEGVPQHWPEDEKRQEAINQMAAVTKPGGLVVVIGNNGLNPAEQLVDRNINFTYEGMPPTRRCFTPVELGLKLSAAGLEDIRTSTVPMGLPWETTTLLAGWGRKPE